MLTSNGPQRSLLSTYCPFCTDITGLNVVQTRDSDVADAFSLSNLLPCGTITVAVHDGESPCPSASNNLGWHSTPVRSLSTHPADTLFRQLAFLTEHLFLRATCRLGSSGRVIVIRIYLIPNDLPNVSGRLHRRAESVVKEARRHMRNIVPLIDQNRGLWDADEACLNDTQSHMLPSHIDNRTMAEIYSDLPSPELRPPTNERTGLSHRVASGDAIWGLRTTLYGYQRHSVSVMVHKESSTGPILDPTYIAVSCISGVGCFIQPSTMTVLRECPMFSPSQSGILCEELGTGKTVMIIALVLVTANQLADPEESQVDERPVMTPLAYNYFPTTEHALARDRAGLRRQAIQHVPSLVEVLVHHFSLLKAVPGRPDFVDELEASHLWPLIRANQPFYHHFDTDLAAEELKKSYRRRRLPNVLPRRMYISSATLVIVPLTLLGQWKTEVDKHCYECVRYLVIRPSMDLPNARKLATNYDLIIMSDSRFRMESKKNKVEKLYSLKPCSCPSLKGSRVPACRCPGDPEVTPLLQIRWKRLVIDEGHTTSNITTATNYFIRQLSIQHKWIVTGTPTSNILGLQLGRATDEQAEQHNDLDVAVLSDQEDGYLARIWGNYDGLNLRKLGAMIEDFVAVPQFRADSKCFTAHVSAPLRDEHGPRPGAVKVLSQVMQMVMVRHRIEDVENDVLLPPMKHDMIYMDLDAYALKSYNAMQAGLAVNAIDSMREGVDYLFHPNNAKELQNTISNWSQGLFWSSSETLYNVDEICRLADQNMARAIKRVTSGELPSEDLDLLKQASKHAAAAANNTEWRRMQYHPDVPFKVSGLDSDIRKAWTRTGTVDGTGTTHLMHADRLVNLRSFVHKNPLSSKDDLVKEGNDLKRKEIMAMASARTNSREAKRAKQAKEMAKEVQGTIEVLKKHVERMTVSNDEEAEQCQDLDSTNQAYSTEPTAARVTKTSGLSGVTIGPSLSTKLNYILSEVQQYSAKEKFLIFSNSVLTLFQIGEALSLFEIKYLQYASGTTYLFREQCVTTFETSDAHRVLLMELKLGARGLNLISASRVIFCEPVWHPDVESQAIKRVHRIGQTRPVTVKTLVIRSTAEEAMIARREYLRSSEKIPNMATESGMRHYLQHPRFLSESNSSDPINAFISLDGTPIDAQSNEADEQERANRINVESESSEADVEVAARVHKKVRFE